MTKEKETCILAIESLVDFEAQPFKVLDDESMCELVESIKSVGVLVPITVRPMKDGKYEIISGHRRKRACEIESIEVFLDYFNNERLSYKLNYKTPVQYRIEQGFA